MQPRSVLLCAICTPVARTDVPTLPDLGASACAIVHTHVTDVAIAMMPASCARAHDNGRLITVSKHIAIRFSSAVSRTRTTRQTWLRIATTVAPEVGMTTQSVSHTARLTARIRGDVHWRLHRLGAIIDSAAGDCVVFAARA